MTREIFANLRDVLAELYPDVATIRRIIDDSGLELKRIALNSTAQNNWHAVLTEAEKGEKTNALLTIIESDYGNNREFQKVCSDYRQTPDKSCHTNVLYQVPPLDPRDKKIIGREKEEARIKNLLVSGERICVLSGMSGIGKTDLAKSIAWELRSHFPDGVLWAEILDAEPGKDDKEALATRLLPILGRFAETYGRDIRQYSDLENRAAIVRDVLTNKRALIVWDNLQSYAELQYLLPGTTACAFLITTNIIAPHQYREQEVRLASFSIETGLILLGEWIGDERVETEKAGAERLVQFVGGLPLALHVIGAYLVNTHSMLHQCCELLESEKERLPQLQEWQEWQKTPGNIRASFEFIYRSLRDERLQQLFAGLSHFESESFSAEAVAAMCGNESLARVKNQLGQLRSLSLIEEVTPPEVAHLVSVPPTCQPALQRYRLHSLLKFFAREKFSGDAEVIQQRLAQYYCGVMPESHQDNYLLLDLDWANIRPLLNHLLANQQWVLALPALDNLSAINVGIVGFLEARGYWQQAKRWFMQVINANLFSNEPQQLGNLFFKLGIFTLRLGEYDAATTALEQAVTALKTIALNEESAILLAYAYDGLAQLLTTTERDVHLVLAKVQAGRVQLQGFTSAPARHASAYLTIRIATISAERGGDLAEAAQKIEEALKRLPATPTAAHIGGLINLGHIYDKLGKPHIALPTWLEGVKIAQQLGDSRHLADLWLSQARLYEDQGKWTQVIKAYKKALETYQRIGDAVGEGGVCCNRAYSYLKRVEGRSGDPADNLQEADKDLSAAEVIVAKHPARDLDLQTKLNRARWHWLRRDPAPAHALVEQAEILNATLGDPEAREEIVELRAHLLAFNNPLSSDKGDKNE